MTNKKETDSLMFDVAKNTENVPPVYRIVPGTVLAFLPPPDLAEEISARLTKTSVDTAESVIIGLLLKGIDHERLCTAARDPKRIWP